MKPMTRRQIIASAAAVLPAWPASRPSGTLVDTHVHLFANDPKRFPYASNAPYAPAPQPLEAYLAFAAQAKIDHTVIVHPEPYQDDHRYLEYCFAHEPSPGFFKGTCLFDPVAADTPARMEALVRKHPGRIVALRIHEMHKPGTPSLTSGPIKDRDMRDPAMKTTWRKAQALGLAIQMHFLPYYAPQIGDLAAQFQDLPVILDHLARAGQGTPAEFEGVLKLATYPRVYMKYSGIEYSSKQPYPFVDVKPLVRRAFDAFGPDRLIWGGLGHEMDQFDKQIRLFDLMFDFASEADRAKIRGINAIKLFKW
jgi:predicted TIM-barrel fold metal-dependent hydrolase